MNGDHHLLALTTQVDEITGEVKPLFSFPVQVCKATESKEAKFDIATPSGAARKQQYVDEATGEVVADADCLRGIRIGDEFKAVNQDAIDTINDATKIKTMVALGKLPLADARAKYGDRVTGRYFVQSPAKGGSPSAYRLTYEALLPERKGKKVVTEAQAIVTKRTAKSRQKMALIFADETLGCLVMTEVEFATNVREPDAQILAPVTTATVDEKQIEMARKVIAGMPDGMQALDAEVDEAAIMKAELIEKAANGEAISAPAKVAEVEAKDNLMDALTASLAAAA